MQWYAQVTKDLANLPACIDYYYQELDNARKEAKIFGNIEKHRLLYRVL